MKRLLFLVSLFLATFAAALAGSAAEHSAHAPAAAPVYQCPMHPWIKSDKPAKCTICGMDLVIAAATAANLPEGVINLSPSSITAIGIETSLVVKQPLLRTLRFNGAIDDDDSRHRLLTARAEGRVEKLHVTSVGVVIQSGAPLYDLYSPELQTAQRELVQLAKAGDLAAAALPAARARLRQMGLTDPQLDELLKTGEPLLVTTILAPDGGTVVEKDVYEGQWLKTGDKTFAVGDFSKMWFMFDAYEQDLPWLQIGQSVQISTRALPGEIIEAPIAFIDPNFNETSHTTKVRAVLANPHVNAAGESHLLLHRVLADARVLVESPAILAAPRTAILDGGNGPVAYVALGDGHFEQRALKLGRRGDALVEVLSGLKEDEKVVTTGALILDGQAQLAREASGHAHAATGTAMASPSPAAEAMSAAPATTDKFSALAAVAIDAAAALSTDDYAAYQKLFPKLAPAAAEFPTLPKLELGDSLKAARRSFEPWSTAAADLLKPHRAHLGLKIFQCPMSPVLGKGRWVQRSQPLKNPFFGSAMADCGDEIP